MTIIEALANDTPDDAAARRDEEERRTLSTRWDRAIRTCEAAAETAALDSLAGAAGEMSRERSPGSVAWTRTVIRIAIANTTDPQYLAALRTARDAVGALWAVL